MQYVAPKNGPQPRWTPTRSVTSANQELARAATAAAADGFVDLLPVGADAPQEHPPLQAVEAATPKLLASFVGLLAVGFMRVACARIAGVHRSSFDYRAEMDTLAAFMDEHCVAGPGFEVLAERLYEHYSIWCDRSGERRDPKKAFVARLTERGFTRRRESAGVNKGRYVWVGIGLRDNGRPPEDGDLGSPSEPSSEEGSLRAFREDKQKTANTRSDGEPSEAKNQNSPKQSSRVEEDMDSGFTGFTPEQERRIRKLVDEGMSEKLAREEVLSWVEP